MKDPGLGYFKHLLEVMEYPESESDDEDDEENIDIPDEVDIEISETSPRNLIKKYKKDNTFHKLKVTKMDYVLTNSNSKHNC